MGMFLVSGRIYTILYNPHACEYSCIKHDAQLYINISFLELSVSCTLIVKKQDNLSKQEKGSSRWSWSRAQDAVLL